MKKFLILIVVMAMMAGSSALVYADTIDGVCDLDPEVWEEMLELKKVYLAEEVAAGNLTKEEADELYVKIEAKESIGVMRGLSFGLWLRDHEEYEGLYDLMPHNGFKGGNSDLTFEEMQERRENSGCGRDFEEEGTRRGKGHGGGFRFKNSDDE